MISISTSILRSPVFKFENYWLQLQDYPNILGQSWDTTLNISDAAKCISAKLKNLIKALRVWQASMTNLKTTIANTKLILLFIEVINDHRDLSLAEWNFHRILQAHLMRLLEIQMIYWKQRGSVKWVQLRDAGTHFFHVNATLKHKNKLICQLTSAEGTTFFQHKEKELLW